MPSPPSFQKVNPAEQPVLYLAFSSPTLPLSTVHEFADTMVAQRISMINGVAQVQVYGGQKYAVRAQLDPKALISRGIGIELKPSYYRQAQRNLQYALDGYTEGLEQMALIDDDEEWIPEVVAS